jgi:tetratricopeptide (TPR) repeat protein
MGKDPRTEAQNQLSKAENFFKARLFKKSVKAFYQAGNNFMKLEDYDNAKLSYLHGAQTKIEMENYEDAVSFNRLAGDCCLYAKNYTEAKKIYRDSLDIISKERKNSDKQINFILFPVLVYLCSCIESKQEEGLDFIKKYQKKVDGDYFKNSPLIQLVTDLTIVLRNKNKVLLAEIRENVENFKLTPIEKKLLKKILLISNSLLDLTSTIILDKASYTTNDIINMTISVKTGVLYQLSKDLFFENELQSIRITQFHFKLSDNLSINKKPKLPIDITIGSDIELDFVLKPHFQMDEPFIGPFSLTFELDELIYFVHTTDVIKPKLISPPPSLDLSLKNLRPPLIGQSFPLEVLVENKSEGEALDVNINIDFPEELKVMRGTINKQIYSLRKNEEMKWELSIKPTEAGDFTIIFNIKFNDPDQNLIELTQEFPYSIKM